LLQLLSSKRQTTLHLTHCQQQQNDIHRQQEHTNNGSPHRQTPNQLHHLNAKRQILQHLSHQFLPDDANVGI
jgi:hypothetical protein